MAEERSFDKKTLLVTGGAGFIGSNFIRFYLESHENSRIINLDKLTYAGNLENLSDIENDPRYEFIQGDIQDKDLVKILMKKADGVVHLAAETHVDRSIMDAGEFVMTDVFGTFILLECARDAGIEIFLHVSTDEVYGSRAEGFFREEDPLNPSSPYAASKTGADRLAYAYRVTYGLPVIITRPSNNYGPYQHPEKFIPLFTTHAMEDKTLPLYGDGRNIRDWLFVEDHCRAMDIILKKGKIGETYNVGANEEKENRTVAEMILNMLEKPHSLIRSVSDRLGHDQRYALECSKVHALGWKPENDFLKSLEKTVFWYKKNTAWWKTILDKSIEYKRFYEQHYRDKK